MLSFVLCCFDYCIGQNQVTFDSIVRQYEGISGRMDTLNGLPESMMEGLVVKEFLQGIKKYEGWDMQNELYYASGTAQSYFGEGWFTRTGISKKVMLAALPLKVGGDIVTRQNSVDWRLSSFTLEVDADQVFEQYKKKADKVGNQQSWDELTHEQQTKIRNHTISEKMVRSVKNEAFQKGKNELISRIDSLKSLQALSCNDSSRLDSLEKMRIWVVEIEQKADSCYQQCVKNATEVQELVNKWQQKAEAASALLQENAMDGNWDEKVWDSMPGKQKKLKYLQMFRELKTGTYRLSGSNLDVSSIPLNGAKVSIFRHGYYAGVSYGQESAPSKHLPSYAQNFKLNGTGRRVMNIRSGIGTPEGNHAHIVYTDIRLPATHTKEDSFLPTLPVRNILLTLDAQYSLGKHFFTTLVASASGSDYTGAARFSALTESLFQPEKQIANKAMLGKIGWQSKRQNTVLAVGYQSTGNEFVTLGNLFLLTNRNGVRLEYKQKMFRQKLSVKSCYIFSQLTDNQENTSTSSQNQYSIEATVRLGKRGSRAWVQYAPAVYTNRGGGTAAYQINLATAGIQIVYPKYKKGQWLTLVQVMNYNDQAQFGDTSTITGLAYGMLSHTYTGKKYSMTTMVNTGFDRIDRTLKDLNADWTQTLQLSKDLQFIQGINLVQRYYDSGLYGGGSLGVQWVHKTFSFGVRATGLKHLNGHQKNQIFLNTMAAYRF